MLERLDHEEEIQAGDLVGVFGGKISKRTTDADWVMAISDNAAVLGNAIFDETEAFYEIVSFVGQVKVRVRGQVAKGDYIVASGHNDGTAIAVSPQAITPEQGRLIVGRAWEAKASQGIQRINTVVGLPESASTTAALTRRVETQQEEINSLNNELSKMSAEFAALEAQMKSLKQMVTALASESKTVQKVASH